MFILDGSGSVSVSNFRNVFLPYINSIAQELPLSSPLYRIAIVLFGNSATVEVGFDEAANAEELATLASAIEKKQENTNTTGGTPQFPTTVLV